MIARALLGLCVALTALQIVLAVDSGDVEAAFFALSGLLMAGLGALLATRRRANPIGWLLLAIAVQLAFIGVLEAHIGPSDDPASLWGGELAAWVGDWFFNLWVAMAAVAIPLVFPDGRLPSPRWRPVLWVGFAATGTIMLGTALGSPTIEHDEDTTLANPFAVGGATGRVLEAAASVAQPLLVLMVLAALAGLVVRFRRSRGIERQQLKWFAYAGVLMLVGLVLAFAGLAAGEKVVLGLVGWTVFIGGFAIALPVAIAMAVLRHRLYDIDVVIRRTLVYGALTATLGGTYLGLVLLSGLAVGSSDLAIAASTLAVAALFRPALGRIQGLVDRRFYRRRYDAARTLEAFGGRLRDEIDLDQLGADLRGVARETLQPAHVSLWLRSGW